MSRGAAAATAPPRCTVTARPTGRPSARRAARAPGGNKLSDAKADAGSQIQTPRGKITSCLPL